MPQLGETVTEGTIAAWHKNVGDKVSKNEILLDVETDKAAIEVPAPEDGIITSIKVDQGKTVDVGVVLAVINGPKEDEGLPVDKNNNQENTTPEASIEEEVDSKENNSVNLSSRVNDSASELSSQLPDNNEIISSDSHYDGNDEKPLKLSPVVRRLLSEYNLDPNIIKGTGRDGRITRSDVLSYTENSDTSSLPSEPVDSSNNLTQVTPNANTIPFDRIRRLTAEHMVRSKATSPHVLQAIEVDFSNVDRARSEVKDDWKTKNGFSLTYLPFISRAVCIALKEYPRVNSSIQQNIQDNDALVLHSTIHLSVAVAISLEALVAPVIKNAEDLTVSGLSRRINELSQKARNGSLSPDDLSGGTYTLSNNGSYGTLMTAPIINQPQIAILSIDSIKRRPVVIQDGDGESLGIRPTGILSQSFDHRAIDGAYSAAFLNKVRSLLEGHEWLNEI